MPAGFKSKKAKVAGEHRFTIGEFRDVDMAPEDLRRAAVNKSLSQSEAAAIRRDLESRPDEALSVTLRAFLHERATVEQEALLGQI